MKYLTPFLTTAVVYMFVPLAILILNGKLDRKRGKKVALWNSVIIGAIFFLAASSHGLTWNSGAAVTYYFLNCLILSKKETPEEKSKRKKKKKPIYLQEITQDQSEDLNAVKREYIVSIFIALASLCLIVLSFVLIDQIKEVSKALVNIVPLILFAVCFISTISYIVKRNRYVDLYNQTLTEIPQSEEKPPTKRAPELIKGGKMKNVKVNIIDTALDHSSEALYDRLKSGKNPFCFSDVWEIDKDISLEEYNRMREPFHRQIYIVLVNKDEETVPIPVTKRSWKQYYKDLKDAGVPVGKRKSNTKWMFALFAVVVTMLFVFVAVPKMGKNLSEKDPLVQTTTKAISENITEDFETEPTEKQTTLYATQTTNPPTEEPTEAPLKPIAKPTSGTILRGREGTSSEITIKASGGSSCVVVLKDAFDYVHMAFFVRAGETVTVGVPAKILYAYFASGDTWYGYGEGKMFGSNTQYSKDDEMLLFSEYTYTYTLYPVTDGNFSEIPCDENEFFN